MPSRRVGYVVTLALAATMLPALLLSPGCDPCPACTEATKTSSATRTATRTATATPTPAPPSAFSQGLIAIDPNNGSAYVPIYSLDGSGNAQIEVVGGSGLIRSGPTTSTTTKPAISLTTTISLLGAIQPVGAVFDPVTNNVFVEGWESDLSLSLYEIDPSSNTVVNTIALTGMSYEGVYGGLLADPARSQLVVAGSFDLATVNVATSPPTFNPSSLTDLGELCTDSIAINPNTGTLFISCDGTNAIEPVTSLPSAPQSFISLTNGCCTDGVAFDPGTNIMALTQEVGAQNVWGLNFASLNTGVTPATAPNVTVPGLGFLDPRGEGPGGQLVVNTVTHQALVADEFGLNFWLVQMPSATVTSGGGALDNNGQPGSSSSPDAASVFTVAGAVLPTTTISSETVQLCAVGDPNSLSLDPNTNTGLMLADTICEFHSWQIGSSTPLFLVSVPLGSPPLGACPTCATQWTPTFTVQQMP